MKILFILPEYYPHSGGGISTYYLQYIKALKANGHDVKVIVGSGYTQNDDSFNIGGVEIEYLKPIVYQRHLKLFSKYDLFPEFRNNLAAAWAMWEQAGQTEGFDIIECTDFGLGFIPWVLKCKKPVVVRLHGSSGQIALHESTGTQALATHLFQSAELALLPLADALISHSTANANFWNGLFNTKKVEVIYPVYEAQIEHSPFALREDFGLVTARIQKWKGAEELCMAVQLIEKPPLIKWFGRDMYLKDKSTTSQYLSSNYPKIYNKNVLFQKPVSQEQAGLMQCKAKFGIVPSTWDMFNFTVLEFMANGTPVICSEGAGASELIEHEKNGFKYPPNDVEALARLIEKVNALDEAAYLKVTENAIRALRTKLTPESIINLNSKLYQATIARFTKRPPNKFLEAIYSPHGLQFEIDEILDKQPFKALKNYFFKRVKAKLYK